MELQPSQVDIKLAAFHNSWSLERIQNMTLEEYADLSNHDSLCYWLEYGTRELGAIGGIALHKFEIWKTRSNVILKNRYILENGYYYNAKFGNNLEEAFNTLKKKVEAIVLSAGKPDLEEIESIQFNAIVKWKIAFIFSNKKTLPVYSKRALIAIARGVGKKEFLNSTTIATLQRFIISFKPDNESLENFSFKNYVFFAEKNKINTESFSVDMKDKNSSLLEDVVLRLNSSLNSSKSKFTFDTEVQDKNEVTKNFYTYDIIIKRQNLPIAVVEIKKNDSLFDDALSQAKQFPINCRYILITNGLHLLAYDRQKEYTISKDYNFELLLDLFAKKLDSSETDELKSKYAHALFSFLAEFNPTTSVYKRSVDKSFDFSVETILDNIDFDIDKSVISFKSQNKKANQVEAKIFDYLLPDIERNKNGKKKSIYRYTTLETLYKIIDNRKYRINGIRGMNDPSDGIFIDKIMTPYSDFEDENTVKDLNKKFVSSCSLSSDDLTMWRLYGDNSKGVCIELELTESEIASSFYIKEIIYVHNQYNEVIQLFKSVFEYFIDKGITFKFKWFDAFKLFFKSDDYKVEKEVRLLFVNDDNYERKWMIASPFGILNPYVEFDILVTDENEQYKPNSNLPFRIKQIILGPNCPFKVKNIGQIKDLLNEKQFHNVTVIPSKIKSDTYIV
ncbi:DUF2971 domain-containing protein [Flavobacterium sp. 25HG05S-40]|uniref:DUF2971 domain-containing protein n=1 Tax=Flavobacterium sp. 25HG05S-40 TaxID=3458682 RepID=UPI004043A3C1